MGDPEEAGSMLGKFGAAFGKGAAKMGKKAAQSEAGRNATRAAIKGASDGVRDDLVNRYGSPTSPTSPAPPTSATAPATTPTSAPAPQQDPDSDDDTAPYTSTYSSYGHSSSPKPQVRRKSQPPKPSLLDRLTRRKPDGRRPSNPRPKVDPKDRIYKQRLARAPDWNKAQLAQALFNFRAEMKCDLEFRKGQVIQVMARTDTQNDWWEGKLEDRVGIFPANYVKLLS